MNTTTVRKPQMKHTDSGESLAWYTTRWTRAELLEILTW